MINELIDIFIEKYTNKKYISNRLFQKLKDKNLINSFFNIDTYNNEILEREYLKYKEYFKNIYKEVNQNIELDEEQIKAISG